MDYWTWWCHRDICILNCDWSFLYSYHPPVVTSFCCSGNTDLNETVQQILCGRGLNKILCFILMFFVKLMRVTVMSDHVTDYCVLQSSWSHSRSTWRLERWAYKLEKMRMMKIWTAVNTRAHTHRYTHTHRDTLTHTLIVNDSSVAVFPSTYCYVNFGISHKKRWVEMPRCK